MQMEGLQYQYLMADEYFLEKQECYSAFSLGDVQFFVNLNDFDAPIFQPSKIHYPYASLIGNYCISDSSIIFIEKVDPLFVAIRVLRNKITNEQNEQQKSSIEFENLFNNEDSFELYLSKCKQIRDNIDCICITRQLDDQLFVKLDKQKLFQFLDIKNENILQYSQKSVYVVDDFNQKKQDLSEIQICELFKQYIGSQLYSEYYAKKKTIVAERASTLEIPIQQQDNPKVQNEKQPQSKSKSLQNKQSIKEKQIQQTAKGCKKMDQYFGKK